MKPFKVDYGKLRKLLPTDKTQEAMKERARLFDLFDGNGNGYLSLAEIDKGVRDVLNLPELFKTKPVIMRVK